MFSEQGKAVDDQTERTRLLDQILDPRNRPALLALYSQLHIPLPENYDVPISRGVVHSLPSIADDYVRFTVRFYSRRTRRSRGRDVRCPSSLFFESCPEVTQGDLIEFIAHNDGNVREVVYIRQITDNGELLGIDRLIEIMGSLLALLPPTNEIES